MTPRGRALEVFAQLRVWSAEDNNGVLIYVLLADRGIHARLGRDEVLQSIANSMQKAFAAGRFEAGAVNSVAAVARELAGHFPANGGNPNELPNSATLL